MSVGYTCPTVQFFINIGDENAARQLLDDQDGCSLHYGRCRILGMPREPVRNTCATRTRKLAHELADIPFNNTEKVLRRRQKDFDDLPIVEKRKRTRPGSKSGRK